MNKCQSCKNQVTLSQIFCQMLSNVKCSSYFVSFLKGTKNLAKIEREEIKHVEIINIKRASQSVGDTVMTAIITGGD